LGGDDEEEEEEEELLATRAVEPLELLGDFV